MKKALLITLFVIGISAISFNSNAQSSLEAGVRGFDNFSVEATIPIGAAPRFHPAVYFDRFGIGTYFDWMFALSDGPKGLKFFPGVGPEFWFGDEFDFSLAGDFGVEYAFGIPLTIGIDWRPAFRMTNGSDFETNNWGISARFRFGEGTRFQKTD